MNLILIKHKSVSKTFFLKIERMFLFTLFMCPVSLSGANERSDWTENENTIPLEQQQSVRLIKGNVVDDEGEPIIGANVTIKGKSGGTITDMDGNFSLRASANDILQISYLGYAIQNITIGNKNYIKIVLKTDNIQLGEVQVIAYGTQKKATITGAVSSVNTKELLRSPSASIGNVLAGAMSGISTVQYSGQPGADDPEIFVRGIATLNNAKPLILVDGVERSFFRMDPNEIENVTVLKDASSTAVFGVRGANGVILVTTRRGQEGKTQISLSSSVGINEAMRLPQMANSYDHALSFNAMQMNDNPSRKPEDLRFSPYVLEMFRTKADPIMFPDTNWEDMLFKNNSLQTQHNLTISGGTKSVKYFISLGYLYQDGLLKKHYESYNPNWKNNRYNYRSNLDISITKSTLLKLGVGGRLETRHEPMIGEQNNLWMEILRVQPFSSPGFVDGKMVRVKNQYIPMEMRDAFMMYYGKGYREASQNTMNLDLQLTQKLDFVTKGLSLDIKGAYNTSYVGTKSWSGSMESYIPIYKSTVENPGLPIDDPSFDHTIVYRQEATDSELIYGEGWSDRARDWYLEASLRYDRTFGDHKVGALLLYNMTKKYYPKVYTEIPNGYLGLVGRATYSYKDKYLFDFNIGYNGSENFAEERRYGIFPAVSIGWIISEENFMKSVRFINFLKVRASYGIVGNDAIENNRFLYLPDSFSAGSGNYNFGIDTPNSFPGASERLLGNPLLTWETAAKQNYGIELKVLDQKLSFTADVFFEKRKDILIKQNTVPGYVAADLPVVNLGKVDNRGYELTVSWNDMINNSFRYWGKFNVSFARNKVIFKDEVPQNEDYMYATGRPINPNFGFVFDRFFEAGDFNEDGTVKDNIPAHTGSNFKPGDVMFKDLNKDGSITGDDMTYLGYGENPEYIFGLNAGFEWKGFDFSMTWTGTTHVSRRLEQDFTRAFNTGNAPIMQWMLDEAYTPERGQSSKFPRLTEQNRAHNSQMSSFWVRDASYVRLKNIEIGYSPSMEILKKVGIQKIRFFVNGYNLLTFDHLKFIDPESKISNNNKYPNTKIYNFGLNINF